LEPEPEPSWPPWEDQVPDLADVNVLNGIDAAADHLAGANLNDAAEGARGGCVWPVALDVVQ
jgi:hypothetical protein